MRVVRKVPGLKMIVSSCVSLMVVVVGPEASALASRAARSDAPPAAHAAASGITWGRCADPFLRQQGARCGMLSVPLDHDDPSGPRIRLALSRVRHTVPEDRYQGVLLVNPGGPGGSGLEYSVLGGFIPEPAGGPYDWIGFDPRGVGASRPRLSCLPRYFHGDRPPYVPKNEELEARWLARSERYANACEARAPELLRHMSTIDTARDMESIRLALGVEQINYLGASYGTYLGQVYTTLFPGRIRRAVFDSSVDPRKDLYELNLEQEIGFDRNVRIWFEWLAIHHDVFRLGKTEERVARTFDETQRALQRDPAAGVIGPAEWSDAFLAAGYCQCLWKRLGNAFASWVHRHEAGKLIRAYLSQNSPADDNQYAVRLAVWCTDDQWPTDWSTWRADHLAVHEQAPLFAWSNAWSNAPCAYWKAPAGTPVAVEGDDTQVLMISETLDAATPYEWSVYVRSIFPNAVLIAEPGGTTHAGAFFGSAPGCVFERIFAFLATGELPPRRAGDGADLVCEPLPSPSPTSDRADRAGGALGPFTEPLVGV